MSGNAYPGELSRLSLVNTFAERRAIAATFLQFLLNTNLMAKLAQRPYLWANRCRATKPKPYLIEDKAHP